MFVHPRLPQVLHFEYTSAIDFPVRCLMLSVPGSGKALHVEVTLVTCLSTSRHVYPTWQAIIVTINLGHLCMVSRGNLNRPANVHVPIRPRSVLSPQRSDSLDAPMHAAVKTHGAPTRTAHDVHLRGSVIQKQRHHLSRPIHPLCFDFSGVRFTSSSRAYHQ